LVFRAETVSLHTILLCNAVSGILVICVIELVQKTGAKVEIVNGVLGTQTLHANDFAADFFRELEVETHFAATGDWRLDSDEDDVVHLGFKVVANLESYLSFHQHGPSSDNELLDCHLLVLCHNLEITEFLEETCRQLNR